MKYKFDNHKDVTFQEGYTRLVIVDGEAEVNADNKALAEKHGGVKVTDKKVPAPKPLKRGK